MDRFKSTYINALFVWFRLYVIKGYSGQWRTDDIKRNLAGAEKELRELESKTLPVTENDCIENLRSQWGDKLMTVEVIQAIEETYRYIKENIK